MLCMGERDGYPTRLFFAERIVPAKPYALNWKAQTDRILERNWHVFSWKVPQGLSPVDTLHEHLKPPMSTKLRMTRAFWDAAQADLRRPHAFAAERVAFAFGRRGVAPAGDVILLSTFAPVDDGDHEDDPYVGARIGAQAIHKGLKRAAQLCAAAFHLHLHEHVDMPWFSRTDLRVLMAA